MEYEIWNTMQNAEKMEDNTLFAFTECKHLRYLKYLICKQVLIQLKLILNIQHILAMRKSDKNGNNLNSRLLIITNENNYI